MFLKVFKYDFTSVFFKFLPIIIILPILALAVRIVNLIGFNNPLISLILVFFNGGFILGCCVAYIYGYVICIIRYTKALFKDQGYLTHTLPVTKHTLLLSQLLVDLLLIVIAVALIAICIMLAYFTGDVFSVIATILSKIGITIVESGLVLTLFLLILLIVASFISNLFVIYVGIALGHSRPKNKTLLSILFCILINRAVGFVLSAVNIVYSEVRFILNANVILDSMTLNGMLLINLLISLAIAVGGYFVDIYLMNKKLNLE